MNRCKDPVEVDLHNLRLYDAEIEICAAIEEAWVNSEECLLLIHGYNNGVAIRDFIRSPGGLRKRVSRNYPEIVELEIIPCDHGTTYVIITGKKKIVQREEEQNTNNVPPPRDESEIIYDNLIIVRGGIPELGMMPHDHGSTFMVISKT
jgi:hypothetical protein